MINIVIPMAGAGKRFKDAGFIKPKPFIDVAGIPMIVRVLDNLNIKNARFILIAQSSHLEQERELVNYIENNYPAIFIEVKGLTEGTACTILRSCKLINNEIPLLIANSDQIVDIDIQDFVDDCKNRNLDGSMLTFIEKSKDPKWSYASIGKNQLVTEVREKVAISEFATVGIYLYRKGSEFVNSSIEMILTQDRVNNEFYTCPAYNYLIKEGAKVGLYNINVTSMHGIGTPHDLSNYLTLLSKK